MTTHLYNIKLHSPYTCSWHGKELICFFPLASAKIRTLPSNILVTICVTWNSQIGFCLKHFLHNAASVWDISVFSLLYVYQTLCTQIKIHYGTLEMHTYKTIRKCQVISSDFYKNWKCAKFWKYYYVKYYENSFGRSQVITLQKSTQNT